MKLPLFHMVAVKRIAQIGLPSMLQQSLVSLSMMMMQGLVNSFGKVLVAGYTAATKIDSLAMLPNMNISNAMSSFTAQNIGAGKYERVKEGLKACLLMVAVFSLLITVISSETSCCPCSWTRGTPRAPWATVWPICTQSPSSIS